MPRDASRALALVAFLVLKGGADPLIVRIAVGSIALIFGFNRYYLAQRRGD
jgi:hypothetical protein